jgi:hypothetical protein
MNVSSRISCSRAFLLNLCRLSISVSPVLEGDELTYLAHCPTRSQYMLYVGSQGCCVANGAELRPETVVQVVTIDN